MTEPYPELALRREPKLRSKTPLCKDARKQVNGDDIDSQGMGLRDIIKEERKHDDYDRYERIGTAQSQFTRSKAATDAQIGDYEVGRLIGSGMIGVVAVARHHISKRIVVLKCMSVDKIIEKNLMLNVKGEIDIHYDLSGEKNILPLLKTMGRDEEIVMVTPYIPGRDLYKFMMAKKHRHLTEFQSHRVFTQLLGAIKSCHSRRIIHRDIKPENIMIDPDYRIYLSDFGLAVRLSTDSHVGRAGTSCYYPYEMVTNQRYDTRADLWCMGVLMVEMLFGVLPFEQNKQTKDYADSITRLAFRLPNNTPHKAIAVSDSARDLIRRLLVPQNRRLTLAQVEAHPWVLRTFSNKEML